MSGVRILPPPVDVKSLRSHRLGRVLRIVCSGPRTNPWYQTAGDRAVGPGELLAFDTDMVGPFGYSADISRTWVLGDVATPSQRDLYRRAHAEKSFVGSERGGPGVEFEDMYLVTLDGPECLPTYAFEAVLLG